ncbi:hypothetical protein V8E53_002822 [Lactarius tabidus]
MAFFPHFSNLHPYGGELHRKGGVLLKARLSEWERELNYLRFRIAEWKEFGSVEHPDYYPFRTFLLEKVGSHLRFELKTFSSILVACEVAVRSIFTFRERISPGEVTRRIHVEEWHQYHRTKEDTTDTPSQMDDMFVRMRNEIGAMERRSKEFKKMVDELVGLVDEMQERERLGGFANGLARGPRIPHSRGGLVRSSSDLQGMPVLADSRARLPPPPIPSAVHRSPPRRPHSSRPTRSSPLRHTAADSAETSPRGGSSTTITPRVSPPPRPPRNPQRRLFSRVFHVPPRDSSSIPLHRIPSPSRVPSPTSTPVTPPTSSSPAQSRLISETRTRLPPPLEASPVPYRPPGQRILSFLGRP